MNLLFFIISLILTLFLSHSPAWARPQVSSEANGTFETTRLKATGGAGVASILLEESAVLNPASLSFFNISTVYLQKFSQETTESHVNTTTQAESTSTSRAKSHSFIFADGKSILNGAIGFQQFQDGDEKKERYSFATGAIVGGFSSFGLLYNYNKNRTADSKASYNQVTLGSLHVVNPSLSVGAIVVDPLRKIKEDLKVVVGVQYVYNDIFSIMADMGSDPSQNLSDRFLYRLALQFNFFKDIYFRLGTFHDKHANEKGNGAGISWISPKLMFDLGLKNKKTIFLDDVTLAKSDSKLSNREGRDISFSVSLRF